MSQKQQQVLRIILATLVGLALIFELVRDSQRAGDFIGYINAGNAVINGTPIYADYLNTWPPFFAVFSVPFAYVDAVSPLLVRLIWLCGIIVSWFYITKSAVSLTNGKELVLKPSDESKAIWLLDWKVFIPLLLILRFVIDDLSNIQINSYLLLASLFVIGCHMKQKYLAGGIVLGFIIALKVYPVFLLPFFMYRKAYKLSAIAIGTIAMTVAISFMVFGPTEGLSNYQNWISNKAMGETILTHKNQSIFPFMEGLATSQSRGLEVHYNMLDLPAKTVKMITFCLIVVFALLVAFRFRKPKTMSQVVGQFFFVLAAIPVLSPLAWKYYFVFTFPLIFLQFTRLNDKEVEHKSIVKWLFVAAMVLSIGSTDGILGARISDVLEVFGVVTFAAICLLLSFVLSYKTVPKE
ncbi:MAG: DUF2029 domain-containing protein [Bacteroidetes bacterium]|jgi:hypothetical protein|nr:DUF2029 domain-containing protein [Bacteroidota bacterium]